MKVSVVLPCYNAESTIAEQLDALARQTFNGEWEVIFVNNGSNDRSVEIAETYREKLPNFRIVQAGDAQGRPIGNVGHSYTVGFAAARGDSICVCESDDVVADSWLEHMAAALETHDFVAPAIDYELLNPEVIRPEPADANQTPGNKLPNEVGPLFLVYANCCAIGMTRECYERTGTPSKDVRTAWDVDYCWRVQLAGMKLYFCPEALVHYRVRTTAKARFKQAKTWGTSHTFLLIRYGMPSIPRYIAYCVWRLLRTSFDLVVGMAQGKHNFAYWVWSIGFAWGQTLGTPILIKAKMGSFKDIRIRIDQDTLRTLKSRAMTP